MTSYDLIWLLVQELLSGKTDEKNQDKPKE